MEPIGFTVGVVALAGLFSTCVECWDYFESAQSLERDYMLLTTKFELEKTRFLMWGNAIGIVNIDRRDANLDSPQVPPLVERILNCMIVIFTDSEALVSKYGLRRKTPAEETSRVPNLIAQRTTLSTNQLSKFKASVKEYQARFKSHQQQFGLLERTCWAIRDRGKFGVLVDDLRQLVDGLREVTPSSTSGIQERNAIALELESLPDLAALKLVRDASANTHEDWSDSATEMIEMSVVGGEDRQDVIEWMRGTNDPESTLQTAEDTLLQSGLDINARTFENLHWAAIYGHDHVVKFLLDNGVSADARDSNSRTALHRAAESGNASVVQPLIDRGANVEAAELYNSWTPLFEAVRSEEREVVAQLLQNRVRVDCRDIDGITPLILAAHIGNADIVKLLIDYGANIEARRALIRGELLEGVNPLYAATAKGHEEAVDILLQEGADLECVCYDGATPLLEASREGHEGVVKLLLRHGSNTEASTDKGRTPLYWAAQNGHTTVVKALLKHGVDVEALNSRKKTILYKAASCGGRAETIRLLIQYGADPEAKDRYNTTPLIKAATKGHEENVEALLEAGSAIDSANCWGWTALFHAVFLNHESIFYSLLEKGVNIGLCDYLGRSLLHTAAGVGNLKFVQVLIKSSVDINQLDFCGRTALFTAAKFGYIDVVKCLLEKGASKSNPDHTGVTPVVVAIREGHDEVVRLLS